MTTVSVSVSSISKRFNRRLVFRDISFSLSRGDSLAITGRNGSGKSTLVKILCGVLSPTSGTVQYAADGKVLTLEHARDQLGLVSPYLQLYDEFSGIENLDLLSRIRSGGASSDARVEEVLGIVGLWERRNDLFRAYSSGMQQRLKYAFALLHHPPVLVLDEPSANLDADGVRMVEEVIQDQKRSGLLIVATNDEDEARWCERRIHLGGQGT